MIDIEIDTQQEIRRIGEKLETLAFQSPEILRLSINAAARKVRKQMAKDVGDIYTIQDSVLKDRKNGAPTVSAAKKGSMGAVIRSRGPVNDLTDFQVRTGDRGAQAKVLRSGGLKNLEQDGVKAFITRFESGHIAVVQRQPGKVYTVGWASKRIKKYGYPHKGAWPDLTKIRKLTGPAVPSMLQNEEVQERARALLYATLDQEIDRRIAKAMKQGGGT